MVMMKCPNPDCFQPGRVRVFNSTVGSEDVHRGMVCDGCGTRFNTIEIHQNLFRQMRQMSWLAGSLLDLPGFKGSLNTEPKKAPAPAPLDDLVKDEQPKKGRKKGKLKRQCDYCSKPLYGLNVDTDERERTCPLYFCPPSPENNNVGCREKWESEEAEP